VSWRLAYRNFGTHESLVTSQSVEAQPGIAGMRWYELRRPGDQPIVWQQATYSPADGVSRWMGSIAQDKKGNMALGYSVSNRTNVFPGIRPGGELLGGDLGPLGEDLLHLPADVGGEDDVGGGPQGVVGSQGLGGEHVQAGPGQVVQHQQPRAHRLPRTRTSWCRIGLP
jgi:hypothetical protein